jgi:hypothetical protein
MCRRPGAASFRVPRPVAALACVHGLLLVALLFAAPMPNPRHELGHQFQYRDSDLTGDAEHGDRPSLIGAVVGSIAYQYCIYSAVIADTGIANSSPWPPESRENRELNNWGGGRGQRS